MFVDIPLSERTRRLDCQNSTQEIIKTIEEKNRSDDPSEQLPEAFSFFCLPLSSSSSSLLLLLLLLATMIIVVLLMYMGMGIDTLFSQPERQRESLRALSLRAKPDDELSLRAVHC